MLNYDGAAFSTARRWHFIFIVPISFWCFSLRNWLLRCRNFLLSHRFSPCCSAGGKYTLISRVGSTLRPLAPLRKSLPTACPAGQQSVVNRADQVPRQVPLVARVARFPAGQSQDVAQPVANVLGKVACETVAPACSKVRRVLQRV